MGVLVACLIVTFGVTYLAKHAIDLRDRARFDNAVQTASDRIQSRLDTYVAMLLAGRGLFAANPEVTSAEFQLFVRELEIPRRYPGVQGIGFSMSVPPEELVSVEEAMVKKGVADFRIWPDTPRDELHAIVFLEPLDRRNAAALGFDMGTEPVRHEAMTRARDSGEPAASGRVILVQEIEGETQAGFLIYAPVYRGGVVPSSVEERRARFAGHVFAPFRAGDLFTGLFGTERHPRVAFRVYDGLEANDEGLLHDTDVTGDAKGYAPLFTSTDRVVVGGRAWTVVFRTRPAFDESSSRALVPWVFFAGLVMSGLLFALWRAQSNARSDAEAQRNNLHDLFMQAPAAIAILRGPELRYELSNPMNQELSGHRDLIGKPVAEALPYGEAEGLLAIARHVYENGEPFVGKEVRLEIPAQDGGEARVIFLNGVYHPLRGAEGSVTGMMAFAYEVTEQVQARQKVEALAEDLARAVRARDEFLAVAGHELKTPLAALVLQIQSLLRIAEKAPDAPPARLAERLAKSEKQIHRLERLVNELLDVSRVSSGRLTLQLDDVDLVALVGEISERFAEPLSRAGCELEVHLPDKLVGRWDRMRLDQVMTNLLTNAMKYGPGKPVTVTVTQEAGSARISVRDRGIGVAEPDRARIFGRFERAVSERHYGGLGLGLWISRQIVEGLGGSIALDSRLGEGSTFTVELPTQEASREDARETSPSERPLTDSRRRQPAPP
jgi:signal transduction histidine kinase